MPPVAPTVAPLIPRLKSSYWVARSFLASPGSHLARRVRPLYCQWARRNRHRVFAIDLNNPNLGFFANLNFCLPFFAFCEEAGLKPYVRFSSRNYIDTRRGPSWFDYFFENTALDANDLAHVNDGSIRVCPVRGSSEMGLPLRFSERYYATIDLRRANALLNTCFRLRTEVTDQVAAFAAQHFDGKTPLAVHFRGTDKKLEAPRVAWDLCLATVRNYLGQHPDVDCVFVASDERAFVDYLVASLPNVRVCHHEDHHSSVDGRPIHLGDGGSENYFRGEDALVNCLLMARCTALIKSSSLLSAWACVFNPELPVVLLNRPHRDEDLWFPEAELAKRSMDRYLPDQATRGGAAAGP